MKTTANLELLQNTLELVIDKLGVQKTTLLLKSFYNNTATGIDELGKTKVITDFVIAKSISIFNLNESNFYNSNIQEYKEARMACYHLLHRYIQNSDAKIAEYFSKNKRKVQYHRTKCDDLLELEQFHKSFVENYRLLEKSMIEFIGKI